MENENTINAATDKLIGHRFGRLQVISSFDQESVSGPSYLCQCSCGTHVIVSRDDLLSCKVLACSNCSVYRDTRKRVVLEYGTLTDYDYAADGIKTCSYCGLPHVYAKGLCKSCCYRLSKNGIPDYVLQNKGERDEAARLLASERRFNARVASFQPSSAVGNFRRAHDFDEIKRMYAEEGLTYQQIGERLGVSRQRVYQLLHKNSIKTKG